MWPPDLAVVGDEANWSAIQEKIKIKGTKGRAWCDKQEMQYD